MADDAERMARIGAAKELVRLITERMATIDPAVRDMYSDQEADELVDRIAPGARVGLFRAALPLPECPRAVLGQSERFGRDRSPRGRSELP